MKRILLVVVCLILFTGIVSGAMMLISNRARTTVVTDTSCDPPCWRRIQPGQTTAWEAVSFLEGMRDVSSIMQWDERYGGKIAWMFRFPAKDSAGYLYCLDSRVAAISIMTLGSLTLAEAFERFGEPDYMWMRYNEVELRPWLEIIFAYPTSGVFARVDIELPVAEENASVDITGNSPVGRIIYFDPAQYEYLLSSRILFREDRQTIMERSQPWPGLGVISYEHLLPK